MMPGQAEFARLAPAGRDRGAFGSHDGVRASLALTGLEIGGRA